MDDDDHGGAVVRTAYIDFANSMSFHWIAASSAGAEEAEDIVRCYPSFVEVDVAVMSESVSRIAALPQETIEEVVTRIPGEFLSTQHRDVILNGLIKRRGRLGDTMRRAYPDLS